MKRLFRLLFCIMLCFGMINSIQAQNVVPTNTIGPVDSYGFLSGPDGKQWTYTASFTKKYGFYTSMTVEVYNAEHQMVGKIVDSLKIDDPNVTGVRDVQVANIVSKKFFNIDNNYELMLFVVANTKQYVNKYFNRVYSIISDSISTQPLCEMPGDMVAAKNIGEFNENYTAVFKRDSTNSTGMHYFDVYAKASYASPDSPILKHTFEIPYANLAALNDLFPIFMVQNGSTVNFVTTQYEKPFFVPGTSVYEDPVVNENNSFVITRYDNKYKVIDETKIPMVKDPSDAYLYTFYVLGSLGGEQDIIWDYNGTGKPAFVITEDNYAIASDGSVYSYRLYDSEGNLLNTIMEHSLGTIYLSDVPGQERQYGFLKNENEVEFVQMVDVPSCKTVTRVALNNGGNVLSSNWDRVAKGDSYQYVVSLLQGENQADGSIVQRIAWFTNKGKVDHYDTINLGQKVEAANVWVSATVLNPYLFNSDDAYEYLTLIKREKENGNILKICSTSGEMLLEVGHDEALGGDLNLVDVVNLQFNSPSLLCVYANDDTFTLNYFALPLSKTEIQGQGTAEDPYQITCVNDFMQIADHPAACYQIMNDIDFNAIPFDGINQPFTGKLDGGKHTLKNLYLNGSGLFAEALDTVVIKDLNIEEPMMILTAEQSLAGFIANNIRGGITDEGAELYALIQNVHLVAPVLNAEGFAGIVGGLVGDASLFTEIEGVSVMKADFNAPNAEAIGGVAGSLATSSSVHAAAVMGTINGGENVGGVAAVVSGGEPIYNCHITADLTGNKTIGGVVATSGRSPIYNCYVEGTITLNTTATKGEVGGIVGHIEGDATGSATAIVVENCLVGVSEMQVPDVEDVIVHRIAGFTNKDAYEYDWDNVDWNKPQSEWPRIYGTAEKCIRENYVKSDLPAMDATIELEATTTEGANITKEELTLEWYAAHGFMQGSDIDNPWVLGSEPYIWFETDGVNTDVENLWTDTTDGTQPAVRKMVIDGQIVIVRDGKLYNVLGYSL